MGKIRSVRGDLMDHGFAAKTTIELKHGEQDNDGFSPFFLHCHSVSINLSRWQQRWDEIWSERGDTMDRGFALKNNNLIKKW